MTDAMGASAASESRTGRTSLLGSGPAGRIPDRPDRQAFLEMIQSPEHQAITHLRTETLTKGELHPLDR
jgi:hypothetical protein